MYFSTTDSIEGHRIVQTGGPVWGVGTYGGSSTMISSNSQEGYKNAVENAIASAMLSLVEALKEKGYNGTIGLTQTTGVSNETHGFNTFGYYVLMGTAVIVE